ncbi:MAG: tRNA pseudouridine(38-40) synthase TruA, partial [Oscillospiraceae bacterium]
GELVEIAVEGDGFLYNMVRIMVGTLLELERGRLASGSIPEILVSRERERAGPTAPACGLWLDEVFYDQ